MPAKDIPRPLDEQKGFSVHALICTYNDHTTLPLALDSVRDAVDSIIVADGAYDQYYKVFLKDHPDAKPWSTDGTLQMLNAIPNLPAIKLIECPNGEPWQNQVAKRNALLNAVPDKDWFIILDSDEMFYGGINAGIQEIMNSGCIQGAVPLYNVGLDINGLIPFWHPRIFLKLPGMHYARKHWYLLDFADRLIEREYPLWNTNHFVLAHLKILRDFRRLVPHQSYMLQMSEAGWVESNLDKDKEVTKFGY